MDRLSRFSPVSRLLFLTLLLAACVAGYLAISTSAVRPYAAADVDILSDACTSIIAGRLATTDGSTITSHTCDGGSRTC